MFRLPGGIGHSSLVITQLITSSGSTLPLSDMALSACWRSPAATLWRDEGSAPGSRVSYRRRLATPPKGRRTSRVKQCRPMLTLGREVGR